MECDEWNRWKTLWGRNAAPALYERLSITTNRHRTPIHARQVEPLMAKYKWRVLKLAEFLPKVCR